MDEGESGDLEMEMIGTKKQGQESSRLGVYPGNRNYISEECEGC